MAVRFTRLTAWPSCSHWTSPRAPSGGGTASMCRRGPRQRWRMVRIYLTTIDGKVLALSATDGHLLWSYQATQTATTVLGSPAPAVAQGIVVAGFGSGELAALRADSGNIIWTDGLGLAEGRPSLVDFLAIRGEPVIYNGQVFATGLGGLTIAADLLTGRRVWERRVASENTPYIAGDWMFLISTDQMVGAININDARIAWVASLPRWENPEKKKDLITWYGPVLAGGRPDRARQQQ